MERPARFDVTKLVPMLEDLHSRLTGVMIENLHYAAFIARYDRAGSLFYIDPPYFGSENAYGRGLFERADFRSEEHTSELQSLMRISYAVFCLTNNISSIQRHLSLTPSHIS